ncbi:MAG: LPS export ABC transporter ATP-binding protein, partial [Proteobacteria bacterium]|nr:LPS export ABC transporter ATP-binding protein [Pseudomonadota bacterium]NCA28777.1 LPS export ABC transporter ATP-binding protein [Pseudomonadota bacterium]
AKNISKSYGKKMVIRDISFEIKQGEAVGLLGPNGAGKTTSFYMIVGLVKADSGNIFIDNIDITNFAIHQRAKLGIGYLPQEASIFRGMTVEQNIMSALEIVESNNDIRRDKLERLLSEFSIFHIRKSHALSLSGGERRRTEIARALATNPAFILLDEPFAGVDPIAVNDIREMVSHLTSKGIGVLITDHNVRETLSIVNRAYIVYDGKVLFSGNRDEIINNDAVKRVYLGENFSF